jgi:hypothetical protein
MTLGLLDAGSTEDLNSLLQLGAIIDLIPPTFQIRLILEIPYTRFPWRAA